MELIVTPAQRTNAKQTELGLIPEDWVVCELKDVVTVIGGGSFRSIDSTTDGVRWLKISNVGLNEILWDDENFLPATFILDFKAFVLNEGDYVMALTRPILNRKLKISRIGKDDAPSMLNQRVGKLTSNHCLDFVYFLFQKYQVVSSLLDSMAGTDPPNLSNKGIYSIKVSIPPTLREQQAIATALSDVDNLISSLDRLIAKKKNIKQGAMQQLLTGKTRLPGFGGEWDGTYKMTEVGEVPSDWEDAEFQDALTGFSSGMTPYRAIREYYGGSIPWITSGELNYNIITDTLEKITQEAVVKTNLKILPKGTFLMAITGLEAAGTRGSCGITGINATTNQSCMALFPKHGKTTTEYLYHYYVEYGNRLAFEFCQGTKQQSFTASIAKILPINLPPTIEEQQAIASTLTDMDKEIEVLEAKRSKYKGIKQGMMQELLTGKTRLV